MELKKLVHLLIHFHLTVSFPVKFSARPSPISPQDWSRWSVPLILNDTGTYRIIVEAVDDSNLVGHAETTINVPLLDNATNRNTNSTGISPKIAFVRPTFTEAAYQENGFYRFYQKYGFPPFGVNITTGLDMLTVGTPPSITELKEDYDLRKLSNLTALIPSNGTGLDDISFSDYPDRQKFWKPFMEHVIKVAPNATVTVIRDEDVNDGHIFSDQNNSTNAYNVLLLFHNEYATQEMYDNYRKFVENGGKIIFIDGNVFYAEVSYDQNNRTITLVKGHDWEFDGEVARRSVSERWFNETKEWVGGNWLSNFIKNKVFFTNNIFNYTHFEEQYVNNPSARIIVDYGIRFPPQDYIDFPFLANRTVATYALNYGLGKVIMTGLFGENMAENERFLEFFDNLLRYEILCPDLPKPCDQE